MTKKTSEADVRDHEQTVQMTTRRMVSWAREENDYKQEHQIDHQDQQNEHQH